MNCSTLRPCFIDHLFLTNDFRQVPCRKFLQFFPFLIHCCLCCGSFHGLKHGSKFVNQINCSAAVNCHLFVHYGPDNDSVKNFSHAQFCGFTGFQNTRKFWFDLIGFTTGRSMLTLLVVLQGKAGTICISNFLRAFLMVFLNSLSSQGHWNRFLVSF